MGLFSGIKSNWKKSEAAVIIQNLLEIQQKAGLLNLDPAKTANTLIGNVWETMPDVFDGKFGQRPHKLSVAVAALATGIKTLRLFEDDQVSLLIALGTALREVETNGSFYPFNSIDNRLLTSAAELFVEITKESHPHDKMSSSKSNSDTIKKWTGNSSDFPYKSFADWYITYKASASKVNKALGEVDGHNLIDIMGQEPLYKAFNDKIDPVSLGSDFGRSFDILNMKWDYDNNQPKTITLKVIVGTPYLVPSVNEVRL